MGFSVPDIPFVEGDGRAPVDLRCFSELAARSGMRSKRGVHGLVDRDIDCCQHLLEHSTGGHAVAKDRAADVIVHADHVQVSECFEQHGPIPLGIDTAGAAGDELDGRIDPLHLDRCLPEPPGVLLGRHLPVLPVTVNLVSESEDFDIVRSLTPVGPAQVGVTGRGRAVEILDQVGGIVRRFDMSIDDHVQFGTKLLTVIIRFRNPESRRLRGAGHPEQLGPWPLCHRSDEFLPLEVGGAAAARVPDMRDLQFLQCLEHVSTYTILARPRAARFEYAVVDAAAAEFEKLSEQRPLDRAKDVASEDDYLCRFILIIHRMCFSSRRIC